MNRQGIGKKNFIKILIVVAIAITGAVGVVTRVGFTYLIFLSTPIILVLLGYLSKILNSSAYPIRCVILQIIAFVLLARIEGWFLYRDIANDPLVATVYQVCNAVVFLFPYSFVSIKNRIARVTMSLIQRIFSIEDSWLMSSEADRGANWIVPTQIFLITFILGNLFVIPRALILRVVLQSF